MKKRIDCYIDVDRKMETLLLDYLVFQQFGEQSDDITVNREFTDWMDENCNGWKYHGLMNYVKESNKFYPQDLYKRLEDDIPSIIISRGHKFSFKDKVDAVAFKLRWV